MSEWEEQILDLPYILLSEANFLTGSGLIFGCMCTRVHHVCHSGLLNLEPKQQQRLQTMLFLYATHCAACHATILWNAKCCLQVSATVLWPGVLRCTAPAHEPGAVRLCLTMGDAQPCSKVISFVYKETPVSVQSREDRSDLQDTFLLIATAYAVLDEACWLKLHGLALCSYITQG